VQVDEVMGTGNVFVAPSRWYRGSVWRVQPSLKACRTVGGRRRRRN